MDGNITRRGGDGRWWEVVAAAPACLSCFSFSFFRAGDSRLRRHRHRFSEVTRLTRLERESNLGEARPPATTTARQHRKREERT